MGVYPQEKNLSPVHARERVFLSLQPS